MHCRRGASRGLTLSDETCLPLTSFFAVATAHRSIPDRAMTSSIGVASKNSGRFDSVQYLNGRPEPLCR